jgi:hypothetical protein
VAEGFGVFTCSSTAKAGTGSQIMPPRLPSSSRSNNYSLVILSFPTTAAISKSLYSCKQNNYASIRHAAKNYCVMAVRQRGVGVETDCKQRKCVSEGSQRI